MRTSFLSVALLTTLALPAAAAVPPDAATIAKKMKEALEPPKSSIRQLDLSISGEDGGTTKWTMAEARKTVDGQNRILTALLSPADARGIADLMLDRVGTKAPMMAVYIPAVRRVRTLTPANAYEAVLGSDFTYYDLGFLSLQDKWKVLGAEKHNGKDSYKIEQTPMNPWHYSKIIAWVDVSNMLPLERDYYDPAGQLWKVETFEDVAVIDNQPVAMRIKMQDKQTGGTSEIVVSKLRFNVDLPDDLFKREYLPKAADAPMWGTLQ